MIPSRFPPLNLYKRIADGREDEWAELEMETNPRRRAQQRLLGAPIDGPPPPRFQNWNHAPFAYGSPYGTRFWGPDVPALELVSDVRAALLVAVERREDFMAMTDEAPAQLDMRVLCHPVKGTFADARGVDPHAPEEARLEVGREVLGLEADGLCFRPVERLEAEGVAVLSTGPLGPSSQAAHFRFVWDGARVREIYSFEKGVLFPPERLDDPDLMI